MPLPRLLPTLKPESPDWLHLDALRFVAAAGIVWLHSHLYFVPRGARESVGQYTLNLGLFVDVFFVISGFIITALYAERVGTLRDYGRFMRLRVARLLPPHLLVLGVTIAAIHTGLAIGLPMKNVPDFSVRCIAHNALLLNAFFPCGNGMAITPFSWTIGIEFALYALFPLLVLLVVRLRLGLALTALGVGLTLMSGPFGAQGPDALLRGLIAFVVGMTLHQSRHRVARLPAGLLMPALAGLTVALHLGLPRALLTLAVFATVALAVAADVSRRSSRLADAIAPLGQLTYATYMWHTLIIMTLLSGAGDKLLGLPPAPMLLLGLVAYAAILAVSYASWRWFEMPLRRAIAGRGKAVKDSRLPSSAGEHRRAVR